jgi:hypothetical protein
LLEVSSGNWQAIIGLSGAGVAAFIATLAAIWRLGLRIGGLERAVNLLERILLDSRGEGPGREPDWQTGPTGQHRAVKPD